VNANVPPPSRADAVSPAVAITVGLVFLIGMAIQRGNTCTWSRSTTSSTARITPAFTSLDYPALSMIGMAVVLVLTIRRLANGPHESFRDFLRSAWPPGAAFIR
jgi:hypothetical protein